MSYYVYILQNDKDDLYIGQTNNLDRRLIEHQFKTSKSSLYTRYSQSIFNLVYHEIFSTRLEAMRREKQIKGWRREKKLNLIKYGKPII